MMPVKLENGIKSITDRMFCFAVAFTRYRLFGTDWMDTSRTGISLIFNEIIYSI